MASPERAGIWAVTAEAAPAWLVAWREGRCESQPVTPPAPAKRERRPVSSARPKANHFGFIEPEPWACDGGTRREAVIDMDHNPPRLVRHVGWQRCIACRSQFFSEDVIAVRLCGKCKEPERDRRKPLRLLKDGHPA